MSSRRITRTAVAAVGLTAIFIAGGFVRPVPGMHEALFLLDYLYIVLLPGYLLSRRIFVHTGFPLRLLLSFVVGSATLYVVLFLFDVVGVGTMAARLLYPALIVALSILEIFKPPAFRARDVLWTRFEPGRTSTALLIVLLLGVSTVVLVSGDPLVYTGDSLDHVAYIRTVSRTGEVFPERFYYADGGALTRDIRKGMGHAYWGTVSSLTGSNEVHRIWPLVSLIGLVFITIAIACAGQLLFQSSSIGLMGALLFLLFHQGSMRGNLVSTITFPFSFGKIFYISALAFLPGYLISGKKSYLFIISVCVLAATWTHVAHFMIFLFLLGIALLVFLLRADAGSKKSVIARTSLLASVLVCIDLPYLLVRYMRDYHPNNPIHTHIQGVLYLSDTLYTVNPVVIYQAGGVLGLLAILALLLIWRRAKDDASLSLLLAATAAAYILLLNPLWVPFLLNRLSYLLLRFQLAAPSMLLAAYLLRTLWGEVRGPDRRLPRPVSIAAGVIVVALLGFQLADLPARAARLRSESAHDNPRSSYRLMDLYRAIDEEVPEEAVIASDPVTSYCIAAFTDRYVMCPFDQHATPNDSTALRRITDSRRIFGSGDHPEEIIGLLESYGARYLVVNGTIPRSVTTLFWKPDRAAAEQLSSKLRELPRVFEVLFDRDGVTLYRAAPEMLDVAPHGTDSAPAWIGKEVDPVDTLRFAPSGEEHLLISRLVPDRLDARRGESVELEIAWVKTGPMPVDGYACYIRFDTEYDKGPMYHESFGKIYRKILERSVGTRFRFKVERQPLDGIYPPDSWPCLVEIVDRFTISIPDDVSPGLYEIRLKMVAKTQYPNYTLRDILSDHDVYSGQLVARLIIR